MRAGDYIVSGTSIVIVFVTSLYSLNLYRLIICIVRPSDFVYYILLIMSRLVVPIR